MTAGAMRRRLREDEDEESLAAKESRPQQARRLRVGSPGYMPGPFPSARGRLAAILGSWPKRRFFRNRPVADLAQERAAARLATPDRLGIQRPSRGGRPTRAVAPAGRQRGGGLPGCADRQGTVAI